MESGNDPYLYLLEKVLFFLPFLWLLIALTIARYKGKRRNVIFSSVGFAIFIFLAVLGAFNVGIRLIYKSCIFESFPNGLGHCWDTSIMVVYYGALVTLALGAIVIFIGRVERSD